MSSVVKTNTMFTDGECLIKAIEANGVTVTSSSLTEIVTDRIDYRGPQKFVFEGGRYVFVHDSHDSAWSLDRVKKWKPLGEWLSDVNESYVSEYGLKLERLAEEERRREEERLRRLVEDRRDQIRSKAKEEGYYVKETEEDGKIRLVLTRTIY